MGTWSPGELVNSIANKDRDDIDAISILGVGTTEWKVKSVNSEYSGDDGFDVTNSDINLEKLYFAQS